MSRINRLSWLAAAGFSLACASSSHAAPCLTETTMNQAVQAPAVQGYKTLARKDLERVQARPYARIPTGAAVLVQAPAGMSEADMYRALMNGEVWGKDERSPLTVPGATLHVRHQHGAYEARVTAEKPSAAREIQRRVAAL